MTTRLTFSAEHTDNSVLAPEGQEVSDLVLIPAINTDYNLSLSQLDAQLRYTASATEFQRNTFDDRLDVLGVGNLNWSIIDQRLSWTALHNSNRLTLDSSEVDVPTNETRRNIFRTGPTMQFNLTPRAYLQGSAYYVLSRFNNGQVNNSEQQLYDLTYGMQLGVSNQLSIGVNYADISFDQELLNYENARATVSLSGGGDTYTYNLSVGPNRIKRARGRELDGTYLSLVLVRTGNSSEWRFSAGNEYTDSGNGLALSDTPGDGLDNGDVNLGRTDVVRRSRAELNYRQSLNGGRLEFDLRAAWDEQDYDILQQDQEALSAGLTVTYAASQRLDVSLGYRWLRRDFDVVRVGGISDSVDDAIELNFRYTPNSVLDIAVWVDFRTRETTPNIRAYEELAGGIRFAYRI